MRGLWAVALVVLWVVVVVQGVVLLGLVRRLAGFLEVSENRLHAMQFAEESRGLAPGDTVPRFEAWDSDGRLVTSAELLTTPVVLLLTDRGCEPCDAVVDDLLGPDNAATVTPLYVVSDADEATPHAFTEPARNLYQRDHSVALAFRTSITPQAFAVDTRGRVVARSIPRSSADLLLLSEKLTHGADAEKAIDTGTAGPTRTMSSEIR